MREANEETCLNLMSETIAATFRGVIKVFDHPDRSVRGYTITHAHKFALGLDSLPKLEANFDARRAF
jgi:bifunctional NMN adenylyltransferase/nudix hydrolase